MHDIHDKNNSPQSGDAAKPHNFLSIMPIMRILLIMFWDAPQSFRNLICDQILRHVQYI